MNPSEQAELAELIASVYDYYRQEFSKGVLGVWAEALKSFDIVAIREALGRHAVDPDRGQFCPKVADVVRLIGGGSADGALMAWAKVDRAVRHVGCYASVVFDDPLIHRVIADMGGWPELGRKTDDEWPFVRNQFATLYRGYRSRAGSLTYSGCLAGLVEMHNSAHGFEFNLPLLLGDPLICQRVLKAGSDAPLLQVTPLAKLLEHKA